MDVVLNEVKYAQRVLHDGIMDANPRNTIRILARYFRQKEQMKKKEAAARIDEFMVKHCRNYNSVLFADYIEREVNAAMRIPLRDIDWVEVSQKELDTIGELKNVKLEKLVFTMLCFAKLYNATYPNNNSWVNTGIPDLYRAAKVTVKHRNDKFLYLNDIETNHLLGDVGLISFSSRNDNLNLRVNFIDPDAHDFRVDDFRDLGYAYMQLCGKGKFIKCARCGRLVKITSANDHSTKYCADCRKQSKRESHQRSYRNSRNSDRADYEFSP